MKRRPQEKEKVKYTSQIRSLLRPADNSALSVTDASTSEWMSETADPPVLELTEENLKRLDESVKQRRTPSILPIKAKSRPIGPQPPPVPPPGWQPPAKQPSRRQSNHLLRQRSNHRLRPQSSHLFSRQLHRQPPSRRRFRSRRHHRFLVRRRRRPNPKRRVDRLPKSRKRRRKKIWLRKPKICSGKQRGVPRPSRERRSPRRRDRVRRKYRSIWSTWPTNSENICFAQSYPPSEKQERKPARRNLPAERRKRKNAERRRRCIVQREWPRPWNTERRSSVIGRKSSRKGNKISCNGEQNERN